MKIKLVQIDAKIKILLILMLLVIKFVGGNSAIWVQNPGSDTVNAELTITGGEIKSTAKAYVEGTTALKDVSSAIYFTVNGDGGAWSEDSFVSITGGTFNFDPSEWVPAGYSAVQNGSTWTVSKE